MIFFRDPWDNKDKTKYADLMRWVRNSGQNMMIYEVDKKEWAKYDDLMRWIKTSGQNMMI